MKCLLFFTALITATAAELTCKCSAPTFGPPCKDDNTCVIAKGQCYSINRQIVTEKDKPANAESKGCQEEKDLNVCNEGIVFISTADVFYLLSNVKCCNDKNNCNEAAAEALPSVSTVNKTLSEKKLVCPSCFMLGKKTCDSKQMNCMKSQDKCYTISGTITKGENSQDFIAKGCATPSAILKDDTTLTFGDVKYNLKSVQVVEAKSGVSHISSCLSFAILLPSVLWFLLDSSLY